jgi:hypothetical protein
VQHHKRGIKRCRVSCRCIVVLHSEHIIWQCSLLQDNHVVYVAGMHSAGMQNMCGSAEPHAAWCMCILSSGLREFIFTRRCR